MFFPFQEVRLNRTVPAKRWDLLCRLPSPFYLLKASVPTTLLSLHCRKLAVNRVYSLAAIISVFVQVHREGCLEMNCGFDLVTSL